MKELENRLDNIYREIKKILSLQDELRGRITNLNTENQDLKGKIEILEQQVKKTGIEMQSTDYQNKKSSTHKNQLINKKIDELLSEVEQCITLLKR